MAVLTRTGPFSASMFQQLSKPILSPFGAHLGPNLGPSWAHLGPLEALLGSSWGIWGPSWSLSGPSLGILGLSWAMSWLASCIIRATKANRSCARKPRVCFRASSLNHSFCIHYPRRLSLTRPGGMREAIEPAWQWNGKRGGVDCASCRWGVAWKCLASVNCNTAGRFSSRSPSVDIQKNLYFQRVVALFVALGVPAPGNARMRQETPESPRTSREAAGGPRRPLEASRTSGRPPTGPKMAQDNAKRPPADPKMPQDAPKMPQDAPKMPPRCPKWANMVSFSQPPDIKNFVFFVFYSF